MTNQDPNSHLSNPHTSDTFRPLLKKLTLSATLPTSNRKYPPKKPGSNLTSEELLLLFQHLSDPNFTSSHSNHSQIGAALTSLRLTGQDSNSNCLSIASQVFLNCSNEVQLPPRDQIDNQKLESDLDSTSLANGNLDQNGDDDLDQQQQEQEQEFKIEQQVEDYKGSLDLVGTGGDGHDTFNVSTTAAMVASGVEGVRICKHGAKASSSTSGSADLLLSLSIPLLSLTPSILNPLLPECDFTFLFAQLFHPSLGPLGPIRRSLGFPTIFNVLGPLINPARPRRCILGVHSPNLGMVFANALKRKGMEKAWVVCGKEGLDEISCEGETDVWELRNGAIKHFVISPKDFGLESHPLSEVTSCSSNENASIVLHLLSSSEANLSSTPLAQPLSLDPQTLLYDQASTPSSASGERRTTPNSEEEEENGKSSSPTSHNLPPIPTEVHLRSLADYTLLQSSALLYVGGFVRDLKEGVEKSRWSMRSGSARQSIEKFGLLSRNGVKAKEEEERRRKEEEKRKEFMQRKEMELEEKRRRKRTESGLAINGVSSNNNGVGDQYEYYPLPTRDAKVGTDS